MKERMMRRNPARQLAAACLVGGALALGACNGPVNRTVNSVHQPVVERSQFVIDLNAGPGGLAAGEQVRLTQWMQALEVGYGDRVAVDAATGQASAATRAEIAAVAERRGLLLADYAPVTGQPYAPGTVRVVVSRSRATVPGCPDWRTTSHTDFTNSTHSNFGCAVNSNLAAMVADPEDLLSGREAEPSTRTGVEAIRAYREAGPRYGEGDLTGGLTGGGGGGGGAGGGPGGLE
jgi:pilus assembly protein CpaD